MDTITFEQAYQQFYPLVYGRLYTRLSGRTQEAEDGTQDIFLKAWRNWSRVQPTPTYFRVLADHWVIDQWRHARCIEVCEFSDALADVIEDENDGEVQTLEYEQLLEQYTQEMDPAYREGLMLHVQGYDYQEIAARIWARYPGRYQSVAAIKTIVWRARQEVRARWLKEVA